MILFRNKQIYKPDNLREYVVKRFSLLLLVFVMLVTAAVLLPLSATLASQLGFKSGLFAKLPPKVAGIANKNVPNVLAEFDQQDLATSSPRINFNLITNFKDNVFVDGQLLVQGKGIFPAGIEAPNVVYSITPGAGILITGDSQNVQISSDAVSSFQGEKGAITLVGGNGIKVDGLNISSTGVTSIGGQTGDITLEAGTGITISGNTISAKVDVSSDTGSAQNIFKNIAVTGQSSIVADSNNDTLTFAPGSGITLTTNTSTKTVTIASSSILTDSGFTDDGTVVRLTDPNDNVGIGTNTPLSKFSVGTTSQFQVNATGAIAAATGITSSGTITFNGLGGGSKLLRVDNSGTLQVISDGSSGQFLGTDGAGNYTWSAPSGAGDITQVGSILSGIAFGDTTANNQYLGLGAAAGRIIFHDLGTDTVNILSANVGIGTDSPNYKLDVAGDVKVGDGSVLLLGQQASDPAGVADGSIYYRTSDSRFRCKENGTWKFCDTSSNGPLSGSGTSGQVSYFSSTSTLSGTNLFFWDSVNNRLGIGTSNPGYALDVVGNINGTTATVGTATTSNQAGLVLNPFGTSAGNTGEVRFSELAANGTNYTGFKAPDTLAANIVYTLPSTDGSSNYVLTTNGSGGLSWSSVTGVGSLTGTGTINSIPRFTSSSTLGDSGFTDNGSVLGLTRDISFSASTPSIAITNNETLTITDGTNTLLSLADGGTSGNLSGIGTLTTSGTVTFNNYGTGIAHFSSGGVISSSAVNLASGDVSGTLGIGNGGTGVTSTPSNGQLLIGNGSGYTLANITNGTGVSVTNGAGTITVANTGVTSIAGTINQVTASAGTGAVTLSLPQNIDTAANVNFGSVTTGAQGGVSLNPFGVSAGNTGEVRFKELAANGSNYVGFKASDSIAGNVIWTLPSADGSSNYVLTTNGSGILSWQSISGVGSLTGSGTTNAIPRFTASNIIGDSGLTDNGSVIGITRDISFTASTPSIAITNAETFSITDGTNTLLSLADGGTVGNLSSIGTLSASGAITFSNYGTGIAHFSSGGVISSSAVNLASGDVSGTLGIGNGGTGVTSTPSNGQLLIGNSTGYTLATLTGGTGLSVTNGAGSITLANTGVTSVNGTSNQVNVSASTGAITFSLPQDINTGANVTFSTLTTTGQGSITANPYGSSAGNTGETRFKELAANGSNYVGFKAPDNIANNVIWTLPASDGTNNYVLTTNGSGVLSWNSVTGVGSLTGSGTTNTIPRFTSSNTLGDSGLTDNGTLIGISRDISFTASTPSIAITNGETFTITDGTNTLLTLADAGTSGNLSGINNLTAGGTVTFSGLSTGIAHFSSGGVISSSAVNLASGDVTGILGVSNGGTGTSSTPTNGQLLIGNGSGYSVAGLTGGTGIGITNGSGTITIANTGVTSISGTTNQVTASASTGAVTLSLPQDIASTSSVTFNSLTTNGQGAVVINPFNTAAGNTGETRFKELAANGSNYVGFKAPDTITSNVVWTLPAADGSNNYVLTTNGSGALTWNSVSGVGGLSGSGTTNTIPRFTSSNTIGDSGLTDNGSLIGISRDISFTASTPSIAITNGETFTLTDGTNVLLSLADGGTVGNLSGIGTLTTGGTVTFSAYGTGIAHFNSSGVISSSAVNLASADVSGTLPIGNGGTGVTGTPTNGQLLIGNGSGYTLATISAGTGIGVTNGSGTITLANTGVTSIAGTANQVTASSATGAVTLSLPQNIATTSNVNFGTVTTSGQAAHVLNPYGVSAGNTGEIRFQELAANGSNYVGFKAADNLTGNQIWTLPSADGSNNYVLTTNGSGVLSWNSISGVGSITGSGTTNTIPRWTGTSSLGDSGLTDNGTLIGISRDISFTASTPNIAITNGETFTISDGTNNLFSLADAGTAGNLSSLNNISFGGVITGPNGSAGAPTFSFTGNTNTGLYSAGTNILAFSTNSTERARIDTSGNFGIGISSPASRLDVLGPVLNTDADNTVSLANFTQTITKNDANTRTFYGVNIKPTLNTGSSNSNTTYNIFNIESVNTSTSGLTTNLFRAADGSITRFLVQQSGNIVNTATTTAGTAFQMNYNQITTGTGLGLVVNGLTSGNGLAVTSNATGITGNLALVSSSASNAAITGNILKVESTGALSAATVLNITNAGVGNSLRVNDDGTDTDSTPFIIDNSGNVGIGTATPLAALDINGNARLQAQGELRYADSDSSNYVGFKAPSVVASNVIWTLPSSDGANNYVLSTNGSGVLSWSSVSGVGSLTGTGTTNYISKFTASNSIGNSLLYDNGTNIGIGTSTPGAKLDVNGSLQVDGQGEVRFADADSSNYVGFKSAATVGTNVVWTLPSADGSNNYVLATNGSGVLSWQSVSGVGSLTGSGTTNTIPRFTGTSSIGDSGLTDNGSVIGITRDISFTASTPNIAITNGETFSISDGTNTLLTLADSGTVGTLGVNAINVTNTTAVGTYTFNGTGANALQLNPYGTSAGNTPEVRFMELAANGTNYTGFKSPDSLASNVIYTLPSTDGSNNYVLATNGSGVLSWVSQSGGISGTGTINTIPRFTGSATLGDSGLTDNGSLIGISRDISFTATTPSIAITNTETFTITDGTNVLLSLADGGTVGNLSGIGTLNASGAVTFSNYGTGIAHFSSGGLISSSAVNLASADVSGTLPIGNGGTGVTGTPTNGQLLIGNGSGYTLATISAGTGIGVTNGSGTITLANTGVTSIAGTTNQVTASAATGSVTLSLPQDIATTSNVNFGSVTTSSQGAFTANPFNTGTGQTGEIRFKELAANGSNYVGFKATDSIASNVIWTLPSADGSNNYVLSTNGSGVLSWNSVGGLGGVSGSGTTNSIPRFTSSSSIGDSGLTDNGSVIGITRDISFTASTPNIAITNGETFTISDGTNTLLSLADGGTVGNLSGLGTLSTSGAVTFSNYGTGIAHFSSGGLISSSAINLASADVTGTLAIGNGGTGVTGTPTNGQLLIGNGSGYALATISAGTGIGVTNGSGTITLANTGVTSIAGTTNQVTASGATGAITLSLPQNIATTSNVNFGSVTTSGQGGVVLNPYGASAGNTGEIRFQELAANGTNYVGFKSPDSISSNVVWTLPSADGSSNYVLTTNGSGVLNWTSVSGVGGLSGSGTTNTIPRFTSSTVIGDSGLTDNGSLIGISRDISFTATTPSIAFTNTETFSITDGTNTLLSLADAGTVGNLSGIGTLNASGAVTFSNYGTGIAHFSSGGLISSSAVNLASADVTGTLAIGNGGTGVTGTPTNGQLLIGNGSGYSLAAISAGTGIGVTNGSGTITLANTGVTSIAGTANQVTASSGTGAVTLSLPQNINTTADVNFASVTTSGQAALTTNPFNTGAGQTGEVRFKELAANGTNYVGFKSPDSISSNVIWTLPSADGSSNYVLSTNGSGVLSWTSLSGAGGVTGSGTTNTIPRFTSSSTIGDSGLTDNGTVIGISRDISFTASTPNIAITNGETFTISDGTNNLFSLADAGTVGNLSGLGTLSASGAVTFSNYGTGIAHFNSSGVISSSAVNLASADVTGTLSIGNGGTGVTGTPTNGQLLIGNGSGYTLATISAGTGIGVTNGSGSITIANTGVTSIAGTTNQVTASGATGAVTLSLPQNIATTSNVNFGTVTTSGQAAHVLNPYGVSAGNTSEIRFQELAANGSNYVGFKASDNLTGNQIWTLPSADGSNNYVLTTNGSGVLSWNSISGVGSITGSGTTNTIPRFTGSATLGDSGLTDNGSVIGISRDISFTATTPSIAITNTETFSITDGTNTLLSLADAGTVGNLSGIGTLSASGAVTFSNYGTGIAHLNSSGVISSSAVNLASADVTGTLPIGNGGTGITSTPTNGQLLIGNGSGYSLAAISAGTGIGVTNGSGSITIANTGVTSIAGTANQVTASGATGSVTLGLPQDIATTSNVNFGSVTSSGQGGVVLNPFNTSAGNTGELRFKELAANGSNYVGFKAADNLSANQIWTLPSADGSNNYVLTTNGSGVLTWNSVSGIGGLSGSGTTNTIPRWTGTSSLGDSGLTDNGSVIGISRDISFTASTPNIAITNGETFTISDGTNNLFSLADAGTVGNLSGLGTLSASGAVTFSNYGTGIAHFNSSGVISSSAVNLASADVTGTLPIGNGGTGLTSTPTNGQLLIGNGSGYSLAAISAGTGIGVTNGSGSITIANTGVTSIAGTTNQVTASGATGAITLSLPQNIATTSNVNFGSVTTSGQGGVVLNPYGASAGNTGEIRFQELAANGTNYTGFKAADNLSANQIWTLPSADGSNNYVLTTNGSGVTSWQSIGGAGGISGSGTTNTIPRFTSSSTIGDSGLTDNGSVIGISRDISFTASTPNIAITNGETFTISDGTNNLFSLADGGTVGNLSGLGTLNASGAVTFSNYGTGIAHFSSGGLISSSAVNLASADVSGTLGVTNGGTGTATQFTQGSVVFAGTSGVYTQDNGSFYYDGTNHRLGLGNNAPATRLDVTGLTLNTDADGTIMAENLTGSLTKNDTNTRQFYGFKIKPTINTGSSNTNTTFNGIDFDTTNTGTTGVTTNLMRLAYGGNQRLLVGSAGNIQISPSAANAIQINPFSTSAGNTGELRFGELAANGTNYTGFKAPDSLASNLIYTLPSSDGSNNYVLTTNGSGGLSWQSTTGIGGFTGSGTTNTIPRFTSSSSIGDSGLTDNGSVIGISRDISFTASTPNIAITNGETFTISDGTNNLFSLADAGTVGNLSGLGTLSASGAVTFSNYGTGIAHFNSSGVISSSAVNLASADVTGTLAIGNGGTGITGTPTNGQLLIGNGTGYTLAAISAGTGIGVTNGSGSITIANTGVTSITGTTNQVTASAGTGAVTLSLPQDIATTSNVNFGSVTTSGQGAVVVNPFNTSAGNTGELRFKELAANGTEYVGFKAPDSVSSSTVWTLPSADGSSNYILATNGSGLLAWQSITASGGVTGTGTTNYIPKWSGTNSQGISQLFDNGTNVGIGTTGPNQKLDVNGALRIQGSSASNRGDSGYIDFYNNYASSVNVQAQIKGLRGIADYKAGQLGFFTAAASTGTLNEWMTITESGNVGIGTTAPSTKLEINQTSNATQSTFTQSIANNSLNFSSTYGSGSNYLPGITWSTTDNNPTKPKAAIYAYADGSGSSLLFGTSSAFSTGVTNTAMTIDPNGNIGIGTFTPGYKLDVNGTANISSTLGVSGAVTLSNLSSGGLVKATTGTGLLSVAVAGTDYQVPLTFSTGLTNSANTITANLSTGVSGGQSAIGGTAASNNLTLSSTSNSTKGKIILGAASAYDEANTYLGIGTSSPTTRLDISGRNLSTDGDLSVMAENVTGTISKNSTVTRTFYGSLLKPTINTGSSNSNTTFNVLAIDTTNTGTTGVTTNLLNLSYGGSSKLNIDSNGFITMPGAPTASATTSNISLGSAISGGSTSGNYIGINAANGYTGDFFRFQDNSTTRARLYGGTSPCLVLGNDNNSGCGNNSPLGLSPNAIDSNLDLLIGAHNGSSLVLNPDTNTLIKVNGIETARFDSSGNFGLGNTSPATRVDVTGLTLNTDADQKIGIMNLTNSLTKNSTLPRTFYGVMIKPTINTGSSNSNTTYNLLNVDYTATGVTGVTTNLLRLADAGTTRFLVQSPGNVVGTAGTTGGTAFQWNANSITSGIGTNVSANALAGGTGFSTTSSATGMTGTLGLFSQTGNATSITGNVVKVENTGASSAATTLMVSNAGTGLGFRVNDDGTDTDSTPFAIDANGNVGVGTASPATKLDVTGLTLNTDADQKVMIENQTGSLTKNDTNTRQFYGLKIKPTLNTGSSNTNTTFNIFDLDTTNTGTTGLTTNLFKLSYGGTSRFLVGSAGDVTSTGTTTTTNGFAITANSLTSGNGFNMSSTSTALTTGNIAQIDWSPGSTTTATGDLLRLNVGSNGTLGNLLNLVSAGSSLFSVSQSAFTTSLPVNFTAAGDTSMNYDLAFTNQTSSSIRTNAPFTIDTGESWESNDLTLKTYNSGRVVLNAGTNGAIALGTLGTQLNFTSGTSDNGGYLVSTTADQAAITGGAAYSSPNWVAKSTSASLVYMSSGTVSFYTDSGLTAGNTFTPTQRGTVSAGGNWTFGQNVTSGTTTMDIGGTGTTSAVCHSGGNAATNDVLIVDCTGTPAADYMEYYSINTDATLGDIVAPSSTYITTKDGDRVAKLEKSTGSYQKNVVGIVSDINNAGDFNSIGKNINDADNPQPVALNGRVKVKISSSSEAIQPGDYITTSNEAGKGMKATQAGVMVGKALEAWDPASGVQTIMIFVTNVYADPNSLLSKLNIDANGFLTTPQLKADKISLGTTGFDLETMVNNQSAQINDQANTIASLSTAQSTTQTNMTDRMDRIDHDIATMSAALAQVNTADVTHVASIEAGLASLEQRTTALEDTVASLSAKLNDLVLNGGTASGSGTLASSSATLDDLTVTNNANVNNLGVTGTISAGNLTIEGLDSLSQSSINTLGGTLKIQSLGVNNVEFVAGQITMDTNGNMKVAGSLTTSKVKIDTSDTLGASAGKSSIPAGQTAIVINTTAVKPESLIFVTATSKTGQVLSVSNQVSNSSFTVNIPAASAQNINFNWWIIDAVQP